jgi:hypothetical protein
VESLPLIQTTIASTDDEGKSNVESSATFWSTAKPGGTSVEATVSKKIGTWFDRS